MHARWGRRVRAVGVVAVVFAAASVVGGRPAAADEGLRWEGRSTYTLDAPAGVVRVVVDITLTNETSQYYYDEIGFGALAEASNLRATRADGGALTAQLVPRGADIASARVTLSPRLLPGESIQLQATYDLVGQAPRSERWTRVNPAFAAFTAFATGDPGLASVEVRVPKSFTVDAEGAEVERDEVDGQIVLRADAIADPATWYASVTADDESGLRAQAFEVSGQSVTVRSWPGDDEWAQFVADAVRRGIPMLEDLVGLDFEEDDDFEIVQTNNPNLRGFGGFYSYDGRIAIDDGLDAELVYHELSHSWFNDDLFSGRWIAEGLAQEYAARAMRRTDLEPTAPAPIDTGSPVRVALAEWVMPTVFDDTADQREDWGYNASWFVLRSIVERVGVEEMRAVIAAADERELSYLGDPDPETLSGSPDWKRFLDLLEERTDAENLAPLFAEHVAPADARAQIRARSEARRAYGRLERVGGEWTPPLEVRRAMSEWRFERADDLIADAREVLETRDELAALAQQGDLEIPEALEQQYESARTVGAIGVAVRDHREAAAEIVAAGTAVDDADGLLATIGLLGADPDVDVEQARAAFADGDLDAALAAAADAQDAVADADGAGAQRIAGAAGALVLIGVLVLLVRRRRRGSEGADPLPADAEA